MSIQVIYKCDKCGSCQDKPDQFWKMSVAYASINASFNYNNNNKQMQVCRPCLEKYGLVPTITKGAYTAPPLPTIEDMIVDIVKNAMVEYQ